MLKVLSKDETDTPLHLSILRVVLHNGWPNFLYHKKLFWMLKSPETLQAVDTSLLSPLVPCLIVEKARASLTTLWIAPMIL